MSRSRPSFVTQQRLLLQDVLSVRVTRSSDLSKIGQAAIAKLGGFKVPVKSDGKTAKIRLFNDTEKPMNITSIDYIGFYNEITRQG